MSESIEIKGLDELIARMKAYPGKLKSYMDVTMQAAMLTLWENVPPYPEQSSDTDYIRAGTLGRTLGSSEGGGKAMGQPDIYEVHSLGSGYEGRFGTNLEYAPYVIGDTTQAWMHYRWWRMKDIAERARAKIEGQFRTMAEKLAAFLDGKGG